jgi:hypothetical protein
VIFALLNHADFKGRDELLSQVNGARVVGRCGCGCATVTLAVDSSRPEATIESPIPSEATVVGSDGQGIGGVLLFVADGRLSELEIYSFDEDPIEQFPPVELLELAQNPRP